MLSRLPIRIRVTLAFTAAMAVVLVATGAFLYLRLASELDAAIDQGLRARAGDVAALLQSGGAGLTASGRSPLTEQGENLAQVLTVDGRVVDATPPLRAAPLLTGDEARRAARSTLVLDGRGVPGEGDPARLLATGARAGPDRYVVVVGTPTEDRRDALRNLAGLLLIGGPAALLLASLAGYGAAAAALRPVERMRREAERVAPSERGRLPVGAAEDEIGRLGRTLNAMLDRLHEAFERERALVADASHELRMPLAVLKAELDLAMRGEPDRRALRAAVASAAEETDRLVRLAEDLLVIARADQGRLPIRRERVHVHELVRTVLGRLARTIDEAGVRVTVDVDRRLTIDGDPLRLEQALGNLVDNAIRHGAREVIVRASASPDGTVALVVEDDGPGFPEAFLPRAFDRFARAEAARARGGTGLGLSVVEAVARAHGGHAGAENRVPGPGARLTMTLPVGDSAVGTTSDGPRARLK